jgi:anti-sigma regulatory factor (Ser/Thr protein kinase)
VEAAAPGEVMARLDRLMKPFGIEDMVTLLYGVVDVGLSSFRFAAAGHLPPLMVSRDGARFAVVRDVDPPLGIGRSHAFIEHVVPLEPGASLLLYTDGLIERREESLTDGLDRLRGAVAAVWDARDPEAAIATVLSEVVGDERPPDDIALVLLQLEQEPTSVDMRIRAVPGELVTVRRALRRWLAFAGASPIRDDVITAAGEACANVIEHAYGPDGGWIHLTGIKDDGMIQVAVRDAGRWRERRTRRGFGLTLIGRLMDSVEFDRSSSGTSVVMRKAVAKAG